MYVDTYHIHAYIIYLRIHTYIVHILSQSFMFSVPYSNNISSAQSSSSMAITVCDKSLSESYFTIIVGYHILL